jgi:uncharacterized membrane protein
MVKKSERKAYAFIASFFSIVGFLVALLAWKEDKYVMHYAKQSLVIFIIAVAAGILNNIFMFIPILGWIIMAGLNILVFVLWLMNWTNALSGEKKDIEIISKFAKKIDL